MRHLRFVSRTPQAALGNLAGSLQSLIVLLELFGQLSEFVTNFQGKKNGTT
jgi:hypothetical protein